MRIDPASPPAIVVAHDDPDALAAASLALRNAGFEVTAAPSGGAALREIRANGDVPVVMVGAGEAPAPPTVRAVGLLRIDLARHEVMLGERSIDVTASEFRLLSRLARKG